MKDSFQIILVIVTLILLTILETVMSIKLSNYRFYGNPSADSARFTREDDTAMHRKDLTVSRKPSVYNAATEVASIPEYRIAIRKDAQVGDPVKPNGQRLTFDLVIRSPLQPSTVDFDEAVTELGGLLNDPEFKNSVISQLFPCVSCEA